MSSNAPTNGTGSVEATLNYLTAMSDRPFSYTYPPPEGRPWQNTSYEAHGVTIHDARPLGQEVELDRQGFALARQVSATSDFYDEEEVRRTYYPEAEALVRAATGAARVFVFDQTTRRRAAAKPPLDGGRRRDGGTREPVGRVHVDHTVRSGPQRVRDLMGDEAPDLLRRRFAIVNVWRPIRGPLRDAPLALCDARSVGAKDLVSTDLIYPNRVGETYSVTFNPQHEWYYFPELAANEAILIKCFDSEEDGRARFAPHTAFEDPTTPADAAPRESIELRTLAFFD